MNKNIHKKNTTPPKRNGKNSEEHKNISSLTKTRNIKDILESRSDFKLRYIPDSNELSAIVHHLKQGGYRIVLTQGVYDLVHEGHAKYLEAARALGDVLIVGVDSDELTRRRKGPNRPIVPESERLHMLVHLRAVDIVTLRKDGEELGALIKLIKPDVYVASESTKDFTGSMLKSYKSYCKEIVLLPPQASTSTSARIRNLTIEGATRLAKELQKMTQDFIDNIHKYL